MEQAFYRNYQADLGQDHKTTYQRAVTLMKSKEAKAFDLSQEPDVAQVGLRQRQVRRGLPAGPPAGRSGRVRSSR